MMALWRNFFSGINAIIFVIDSTNKDNIEDVKEVIRKLLIEEELKECPFLVMANQQDIENAVSPEEIKNKIWEFTGRKFDVIGTSAKTGQGIKDGFEWVFDILIKKLKILNI